MAVLLYRLGRTAFRRRWYVAVAWVTLLVATGVGAATTDAEYVESFQIPGTESQETMDLLQERFPGMVADGANGRVVFVAPEGETLAEPENQMAVQAVVQQLADAPDLVTVADPFEAGTVSADGTMAYAEVSYAVQLLGSDAREALFDAVETGRDAGLTVEVGGEVAFSDEELEASSELIGLAIAAVVLIVTFGSFVAAGMPLLNAIIGIGVTISAIAIASRFVDMSENSSLLALMLGIALAIDYSLFIAARYRHELASRPAEEAAGRAVGTAGNAVVFAGLTVMIALVGLSIVGIPLLTEMGLAAAFAVAMAVLIALTMLPALFGFAGKRILSGQVPGLRMRDPEADGPTLGLRWVRRVTAHPVLVLVVAVVGLGAVALPASSLQLGLPDDGDFSEDMTQRRAYDLLAEGFGPGVNGPLLVVVDGQNSPSLEGATEMVVQSLSGHDNVVAAVPAGFNEAGDTAMVTVVPGTGPSAEETEELVEAIRDLSPLVEARADASVNVTGSTAIVIDFNEKVSEALIPYLAVVVGLSFLILVVVFRSILVPLKAALGFLVTMGATFGAAVAVFQWGWFADVIGLEQTGPIISVLPIVLIGLVFGLAMDYQVFLVTRMREEHVHGAPAMSAVVTGFQHGARVVTAAATIMISVFAGFVLGEDFIKQVGFALAFAVFVDAFLVRMTIVPAILALLGERAWWLPRWLDRILPDVDVEGDRLRRYLDEKEAPPAELARTET